MDAKLTAYYSHALSSLAKTFTMLFHVSTNIVNSVILFGCFAPSK